MSQRLVVVDYGAGNLRSVSQALLALGLDPVVTNDPHLVESADAVILPGVGAAGQIMRSLRELELDEAVRSHIARGRPFLGVCMGMQVLMDWSEENGGQPCLGVVRGEVRQLEVDEKIPHMGWNAVHRTQEHPVWAGIPDDSYFYFVHSYVVHPAEPVQASETDYAGPFVSAIARDNVFATQFHPEKSGRLGLQIYQNFVLWASKSFPA
jgi:imidazole glycerol-phosphate synthase subunit HisH